MNKSLETWAATHVGLIRTTNEDRFGLPDWKSDGNEASWHGVIARDGGWAVVADGMGGHGAGGVASDVVVDVLSSQLPRIRSDADVTAAIQLANEKVHEAMFSERGRPGMGSTVVGLRACGENFEIFNVGDSRAYLFRNNQLRRLSVDHTPEGATNQKFRSHALTQSMGGTLSRVDLVPHLESISIRSGDQFLLCSDGVTDLISEDDIIRLLSEGSHDPTLKLVDAALTAGGRDNITAILIKA